MKDLPEVKMFNTGNQIKVHDFWIISLAYAKSLFKIIFGHQIFV